MPTPLGGAPGKWAETIGGATPRPAPSPLAVGQRTLIHRFADFDAFSLAPPVGGFEMVLTGPESGLWRVAAGLFSRSSITFGLEGGANVSHAQIPDGMIVFRVVLSGNPPICAGRRLDRHCVAVHGPGAHLFEATLGRGAWANYAADPLLLEALGAELGDRQPIVLHGERRVVAIDASAMGAIRRALARARHALLRSPSTFKNPVTSALLQRDLAVAYVKAVHGSKAPPPVSPAERRHLRLLIASMEYLGATKTHAVTLPELCGEVRTTPRTLTRVFHDAFRISPARYLRLRRMGQVRAHLRRGTPRPDTVTRAALQFAFSELGRFSVEYRRLFGESPSTTLQLRGAPSEPRD